MAHELLPTQELAPNCFCCGQDNPSGLRLRFAREDEVTVSTRFTPPRDWTGFGRILHGGFQALLLDETMCWAPWGLLEVRAFVTQDMTLCYLQPVYVEQPLVVIGRIVEDRGREILTEGEIRSEDGRVLTTASATVVRIPDRKMASMMRPPSP
jgi:acyl-coenzyme A thioesterase PaaI-like protein